MKTAKRLFAVLFVVTIGGAVYFLNGALPIGTGYSAKYVCSQVFLADRNPETVFEKDVRPTHPLFRTISPKVDYKKKTVTAKAFGFWKPMTALFRDGCGCTLAVDTDIDNLLAQSRQVLPRDLKQTDAPWPFGSRVDLTSLPEAIDTKALTTVLDEAFTEPGPDTMRHTQAVVIVLKDRIIAERYAKGFGPGTPVLGWSMAKSVTAVLTGILVKDKALDIKEPAPVAEWKKPGDPRRGITLDMLLRMSSGLAFDESYAPFADATDMLYGSPSMAAYAASKPLEAVPGTKWSYSSGTANIISRILFDKTGGSLASVTDFTRNRLFRKIGAYSALIEPDASGCPVGSSYMYATARDWARVGLLLKNNGIWNKERLLPENWVTYMTTPTPGAPKGEYGAQIWLNAGNPANPENRFFPSLPRDIYFFEGFNQQIVAVLPSQDLVVVRLGATQDGSWSHETFLRNILNTIRR